MEPSPRSLRIDLSTTGGPLLTSPSANKDSLLLNMNHSGDDLEECSLLSSSAASPGSLVSSLEQPLLRKISSFENLPEELGPSLHTQLQQQQTHRASSSFYDELLQYWRYAIWDGRIHLLVAILAWYIVGLLAIVTTKLLLMEWRIPPLLLTFQQLIIGSHLLKLRLLFTKEGIAAWPWNTSSKNPHVLIAEQPAPTGGLDFLLTGLFNALDLLASNAAFATSAASFVETIKSSDPISTTAVALVWKVDRLETDEGICLFILVAGMLLSTWGNAVSSSEETSTTLAESTRAAATVMTANFCFAFRAMSQKMYRRHASEQMSDENLLAKMFQIGWILLGIPCLIYYTHYLYDAWEAPRDVQLQYLKLASVNSVSFATYNLASTYVLSKLTVLHHSTLGCVRRMFIVIGTCIFFGVPMTAVGAIGLVTCFGGFCGFTFFRAQRKRREEKSDV